MEGIRYAWKVLTFSNVPSSSRRGTSISIRPASPARSSSRSTSRRSRRIPLHRACSVPIASSAPLAGRPNRSVRPGAYQVIKSQGAPRQHRVIIPEATLPGSEFTAMVGPREVQVTCPATSKPGNFVRVVVPGEPTTRQTFLKTGSLTKTTGKEAEEIQKAYPVDRSQKMGSFKIRVPLRVKPGMTFVTTIRGKQYSIICPNNLPPRKRKIRVSLDAKHQQFTQPSYDRLESTSKYSISSDSEVFTEPNDSMEETLDSVDLQYDGKLSHGWIRRLRPWNGKFQWMPTDQFDDKRSVAYFRHLTTSKGKDERLPTGNLTLVASSEALSDTACPTVSPETIREMQSKPLDEKTQWVRSVCQELDGDKEKDTQERSIKMVIRREHLLEDSIKAVMSLGTEQLRQPWKVEFVHEPAVDSGGVTREWFQLVSEQIFDPDSGLWVSDATNQRNVSINPDSAAACSGDHLMQFRFAGRLLARALFDQQIVQGHLAPSLYKHILGWPLMMQDLADQDQVYYDSLKKLELLDDIESMGLDFTVTEHVDGRPKTIELVPGGASLNVTSDNLQDYYQALLRYRMMERNNPQLTELLLGFFDVVQEAALAVFDPMELELTLCGLPAIDVEDWKANTRYSGSLTEEDPLVEWFWKIVTNDFDHKRKARLLQFATGTAGVPCKGFGALRGADGAIKSFSIHVTDVKSSVYPRAHTCFNRIDLPRYESKEELSSKLDTALSMSAVGFGMG